MADVQILPKGASVSIKEKAPSLTQLLIGCGWDVAEQGGKTFDLDLTAALLKADGKVVDSKGVVYYGNLKYGDSIEHMGDNLTGEGEGDDEQMKLHLDKIPAEIERIVFLVNIYEADSKGQNFGMVNSSFVRLVNAETNEEFARHDLQKEYASNTGVLVGELYRENGSWHFKATAEGVNGSIDTILKTKGME